MHRKRLGLKKKSFLFLQGVCSPFFLRLADNLVSNGHEVRKLHFTMGDDLYWRDHPSHSFRSTPEHLTSFLQEKYQQWEITDQVLFGDRRPVHLPAIAQGREQGVRTHVFEEGYFRPHWITLERNGVNAYSSLPKDPHWYREVGKKLTDKAVAHTFSSSFAVRATHDVLYHAANALNPFSYPKYRSHAPCNAIIDYVGHIRRLALSHRWKRRDSVAIEVLIASSKPYYFLPLQLNSDAQIRDHSSFDNMHAVMAYVMDSFARNAAGDALLVIKNHPLNGDLLDYPSMLRDLEKRYALLGRTLFLETGDLTHLLKHAKGTVTVNSTVGAMALELGCPTITLSDPVYNLIGLTFQGQLDTFWKNAQKPDTSLFCCFRNTVIQTTQVNGGFYSAQGIALAVENSARTMELERSLLQELL
ncbi:MAG: Capsule polysaccharide biosynthesis protein [Solimicrobium sp.]|jgi:capsular polysaccharide export protein|nr:Capsule polysaccharide biosynthesis protein [Solimicrobium sp.]